MSRGPDALRIEGELNIYRVAELAPVLIAHARAHPDAALDLANVTEIDAAGIQLLLVARREAHEHGGELRLQAPSDVVHHALAVLCTHPAFALVPAPAPRKRRGRSAAAP